MADYSILPDIVSRYQFCMSSLSHPAASPAVTGPFSPHLLLYEATLESISILYQYVFMCECVCVNVCRGSDPHLTPPALRLLLG